MLLDLIILIVVLNLIGGFVPTYRTTRYYGPSWGGIVAVILVLYFLGYLHR